MTLVKIVTIYTILSKCYNGIRNDFTIMRIYSRNLAVMNIVNILPVESQSTDSYAGCLIATTLRFTSRTVVKKRSDSLRKHYKSTFVWRIKIHVVA